LGRKRFAARSSTSSGSSSETTRAAFTAVAGGAGSSFATGFLRAPTRFMADALYMKAVSRNALAGRRRLRHHRRHSSRTKETP
jgi:hypothetical protein